MSFPPPPNQRFAPPPPPGGGGFAPPPPPPGGGGFAPPPPGPKVNHHGGFAPPPPPGGGHQNGGGGFAAAPPPPGNRGGGFAPPPPPSNMQQSQQSQNLNNSMGNLSMQGHSPAPGGFAPPPPGRGFAPPAPGGFAPPPPAPGGFAPPTPGNAGTPGSASGRSTFQPPPPGAAGAAPQAPMMMSAGGGGGGANNLNPPGGPPSPFYAPAPSQGQMDRVAAANPAAVPGVAANPPGSQMNENIDYSVTIPDRLFRWTAAKLPQTAAMAASSKIPLGAVLRPLAPDGGADSDNPVDTVQPGTAGIVRCKRCRTYINAFVTWSEHGRRWRCNICAQSNDVPSAYFCHLDELGLRRDRADRPELSKACVEFVAPAEYMVRPPQEPTYFFVLDVSATAVRSGVLASASQAIKASLDDLPGRGRTKIGFITFDNGVHYFNLSSELSSPQMLVVSDLKELFVPLPDNLLVNLKESRAVVESFLDSLPEMFAKNPVVSQSCLGPALKAAFTVMKQIGGKMSVFQSIMPNLGDGALKPREQPGIMGTPNEVKLLKPDLSWYKDTAIEFSRQQISVDMYLFPYQYMDMAALGELAKFTAGSMHSYVNFSQEKDGPRFEALLNKSLTQQTAFEAVMRIRCTKGMRITNFYGNFYIRGTDLLALPNCNTDSVYGFDLAHDEQNVTATHVTIQAALLYTSSDGERRIRVMTQALPVSSLTSEVVGSINADACCALLAKQALDVAMKSSLDNARMRLQQVCIEMIRAGKGGDKRTVSGYSVPPPSGKQQGGAETEEKPIPENLALLPLYTLAMMKNVAFRGGTDVHPDERVQSHHLLNGMWVGDSKHFVYPRMFALHSMDQGAGYPVEGHHVADDSVAGRNRIQLPAAVNLSVDRLTSDGVFLLDNGVEMYLWVGRTADLNVVSSLFGVHSLDEMDPMQIKVLTSGDKFASRFGAITEALRESDGDPYFIPPKINVVREGDAHMEARFFWFLIEDRASFQGGTHSYDEFMQFVNNPQASSGSRQAPPGPGGRGGPPGPPAPQNGMPPPPGQGAMPPPPPNQPMGMPQPGGMHMPPPNQPMGMPPPAQAGGPPGMARGMPPPAPQHHGGPPPGPPAPPQPSGTGGPPPARNGGGMRGPPPAMNGGGMSGPPPSTSRGPPASGGPPPPPATGGPPAPHSGFGGPPPAGPPSGGFNAPPAPRSGGFGGPPTPAAPGPPAPRGGGFGGPPPPGRAAAPPGPPPPGRAAPPGPPPPARRMAPPPPRGTMPRPPPPR